MNGTNIKTRTFYIKSQYRVLNYEIEYKGWKGETKIRKPKLWNCQAWENGQLFKEWNNRQITVRYQANIYAILSVVIELAQAGYKGEIIAYIPDQLIVDEAHTTSRPFKERSIEELEETIKFSWEAKPFRLTRWIYLGEAFKRAKENGIDLNIKLLEKNNIEIINKVVSQLLEKRPTTQK